MLTFTYKAKDLATKKIVKSTVEAESETEAGKLLMSRNLVPLNITAEGKNENIISKFTNRITTKDKVIFSRQLATLISAGLPLTKGLHTALEQTNNKKLKAVIQSIISNVEAGSTLAFAFEKQGVFNQLYIALIAAGEVSGTLDKALERIANQQEKDAEIASKVKGAMVYPGIVMGVMAGVIIFMLTTVVPQVEILYTSLGKELPLLTKLMVGAANVLTNYWYLIVLVLVGVVVYGKRYAKTPAGKRQFDIIKLKMPMFGKLFSILYMARFARTGETLLMSGVPMLEMLRIAGDSVGNVPVQEALSRTAEKVKSGKSLATALKNEELILPLVSQMISIGEQSGSIDNMMGKAASFYEKELDDAIKTISTAIEPILMVLLAVVAGGMVGAILFPIYGLVGGSGIG